MHERGHIGLALLFVAPYSFTLGMTYGLSFAIVSISLAVVAADLPDHDQKISFLSHRGITHTLWAIAIVTVGSVFVTQELFTWWVVGTPNLIPARPIVANTLPPVFARIVGVSVLLGYSSHIFGDMMTVGSEYFDMNVKPLYPLLDVSFQLGITKADSNFWNTGLFGAGSLAVASVVTITL